MTRYAILLVAACQNAAPPPPTKAPPITNVAPPAPPPVRCVPRDAGMSSMRLVDKTLVACFSASGATTDVCWTFDLASSAWSFTTQLPTPEFKLPERHVTASPTAARVCRPDGSDCKTVPLSGVKLDPTDPTDRLQAATNFDRSIVAVWSRGPVWVFDALGTQLATIKPWAAGMNGDDPSVFREVHILGSTIEVEIADTPVTSAMRLYTVRGKPIADVFKAAPMEDTRPPLDLDGRRYVFIALEPRTLVVVDVVTGKQLGAYPAPGTPLSAVELVRTPDGNLAGVMDGNAIYLDVAKGKLTSVAAPMCAAPPP